MIFPSTKAMNKTTLKQTVNKSAIDPLNAGYWEIKDDSCTWSSGFAKNLGFQAQDIEPSLNFFIENLIHPEDKTLFRDNFFSYIGNEIHFSQHLQILNKENKYVDFTCKTNAKLPINFSEEGKFLFFFKRKSKTPEKVKRSNFYYYETAEMTSTGSWYIDFEKRKSYWDYQAKLILNYPEDYIPSLNKSEKYFAKEHHKMASELFMRCAMTGESLNVEIKMQRSDESVFWARAIGKAVYNDDKDIIGIRGVFQDIDEEKRKSLKLQKTSEIIVSQNNRLFNFAHIVSHNLRSHTSNLQLIAELVESSDDLEEKLELIGSVKSVSESLNQTIEHLNEIVTIQSKTDHSIVKVSFQNTLKSAIDAIGHLVTSSKTAVRSDFSEAQSINYVPAYLDSILLNLLTNAIKYKHPERTPVVNIKSYLEDGRTILEIADNGIGIDLKTFGEKIFGMYKTFHYNEDAVGIGLFITRNQIESLNGEISVESEVGKGTTFKIIF